MRIAVVNANTTAAMTQSVVAHAASVARDGTTLVGITPTAGVPSVESHYDEVWGAVSVLTEVERVERTVDRPDAYVIACFGDTGLPAAREIANGPVVGMTEAALLTATLLAHRFSIITMPQQTIEQSDRVVRALGLEHRCTVRAVDEPVAEVRSGSGHLLAPFLVEARRALADDSAEAIILGCAGLSDLVQPLQEQLGVPVIDGVSAGVVIAEGLVAQRLSTSRACTWSAGPRRADHAERGTSG